MATSNAMNTSNQRIKYTISVTLNSQSVADNTSNVTVQVRFYRTNTGYTSYGNGTVYCIIDGTKYSASVTSDDKITNSGIVLFSKTLNISHGSDGKKTLSCSAWIDHDVVTSDEQSYSQALPAIYRASVPTVCTLSGGLLDTITMGDTVYIYTNRNSSSFTHTIKYDFTVISGATISNSVGGSCAWKVPDLAQYCNNETSAKATITCITYNGSTKVGEESCEVTINVPAATTPVFTNGDVIIRYGNPIATNAKSSNFTHLITYEFNGVTGNVNDEPTKGGIVWWTPTELAKHITSASGEGTITCTTYNGTAEVGKRTMPFTAVVPNEEFFQPKVSEFNISPTGGLPSVFDGLYVQGKTGVQASFTASSDYSEIDSFKITVDGVNYIGNPATSLPFTRQGLFTVAGTVTDKRGFSTTITKDVTVYAYSVPSIEPCDGHSSIVCERSKQDKTYDDAGTHLHVKGRRRYSPFLVDAKDINFCAVKYQFKEKGGSWSAEAEVMSEKPTNTDDFDVALPDVVSQTDKVYSVRLIVTDTIGSSNTYEFAIPTADVTLHLGAGGYGVAVGKYSSAETPDKKMFESAWDAYFEKNLYANHIAPLGLYEGLDFNELVYQTGYYAGSSAPEGAGCSNFPINKTGVLEVISHMQQNKDTLNWWGFAYQTYRSCEGEVYMRSYYTGSGWTPWAKITTT